MEIENVLNKIIDNRYKIISILGQGSTGITYAALDLATQSKVAVKAVSLQQLKDWKQLELLEREAKVLAQLNHSAIPKYLDYFHVDSEDERIFYIVQQLASGKIFSYFLLWLDRVMIAKPRICAIRNLFFTTYLQIYNQSSQQRIKIIRKLADIELVDLNCIMKLYEIFRLGDSLSISVSANLSDQYMKNYEFGRLLTNVEKSWLLEELKRFSA
jgi:eukaryotic-like serine/threonine-protein kinase